MDYHPSSLYGIKVKMSTFMFVVALYVCQSKLMFDFMDCHWSEAKRVGFGKRMKVNVM